MNEKKTVLFLMNGFGAETSKSFEVFSKETMPTFNTLMGAYPFKLLFSGGEMIGANKGEVSNFKSGYYSFSTFGHPSRKEEVVSSKIASNEFAVNPIIINSIDIAVKNRSRLHIIFTLGDKVDNERYEHLKSYLELAVKKGAQKIYVHIILGDSSLRELKIANQNLENFRNRVIRYYPQIKIVSIASRKYIKNGSSVDIANYYRMMVSGVGEFWSDYTATISKKYEHGMTDDDMNAFITVQEQLINDGDSIFAFNYSNNIGKQFFDVIMNPKKYFPTSSCPSNIAINSLFPINNIAQIKSAFVDGLPQTCLFDKIPNNKKILIIASKDRIPYISKTLNGFKQNFENNVNVWPIEDKKKRFESLSQYLAAYINQDIYDLIIADCELYNSDLDVRTIDQLKNNLKELDKCLNITYNRVMEKNYRLIATSLYGIRDRFKLTDTMELVDLSNKTPFLLVDKEIRRVDVVFKNEGTFIDVARLIAISFGSSMPNNLIVLDTPEDNKKSNKKKKIIIIIPIAVLLILIIFYIYYMFF